jgi:hypothetical protein
MVIGCATQRVVSAFRCCATKVGRRRLLRPETTRNRARWGAYLSLSPNRGVVSACARADPQARAGGQSPDTI